MSSIDSKQFSWLFFLTLFALVICLGTTDPVSAQTLTTFIEWTDSLRLEEPEGVFTVRPEVRVDPSGGFIVTDSKESQVRLYTRTGELKDYFGRKGTQAPGALKGPTAALRLPSGRILVPGGLTGNLSLFAKDGTFIKRYSRVVIGGTNQVHELPGEDVLLVGSKTAKSGSHPLLHRFDPETGTIEQSFFPHPVPLGSYRGLLFSIGRIATADVRDSTIVAAFALLNKLYLFNLDGTLKREVKLPLGHFRKIEKPGDNVDSKKDVAQALKGRSRAPDVFWLNDDVILFQYYNSIDLWTGRMRWNLAAVTPEGEVLFEIQDTPQLLAVDSQTQELFFSHPDYDVLNHWIVGRLKSQVLQAATE